jgi:NAD(P)-dependent dehydrogenase (short-subunit alcohol dehydrogenase family)
MSAMNLVGGNRLTGKVAIVTGAGSAGPGWGNGRAAAVLFAAQGARVVAVDRDAAAIEETLERTAELGGEVEAYCCDVTDAPAVGALIGHVRERLGRIDVLVNNVGGSAPGGPVEMDEAVWDAQLEFNLKSVFLMCKHALPVMAEQRAGSIVNISSASGLRWTGSPQIAYASAKAAIAQFSRVTAVEYAARGIRVNTVTPGQLHTPLVETRLVAQRGGDLNALLAARRARIPLGFMGDGRDVAYAALYLASDESRFVTGADIVVDGGMTVRCD